ncbi:MAG: hypothetical protein GXP09_08180 [Gammaproteobacteria bacterium]|nr:hypothetical protein [Gammaproteobacteria bacterium]
MIKKTGSFGLIIWLIGVYLAAPLYADGFADAVMAYQKGDFKTAKKLWQPLAEKGEAAAQFNLGVLYAEGQSVKRDYSKAAKLYEQAAGQGYPPAQFNLGVLYEAGRGVKKNIATAASWWTKAAEQGFAQAQYNLGTLYFYGRGVKMSLEQARHWFVLAAETGDKAAIQALKSTEKRLKLAGKTSASKKTTQAQKITQAKPQVIAKHKLVGDGKSGQQAKFTIHRGDWIAVQNSGHYTIQLFANWTEASILTFIKEHDLKRDVALFKVLHQGKPWFSLIQGVYPTLAEADRALKGLSPKLRVMGAWIRRFAEVQDLMARGSVEAKPVVGVKKKPVTPSAPQSKEPTKPVVAKVEKVVPKQSSIQVPRVPEKPVSPPPLVRGDEDEGSVIAEGEKLLDEAWLLKRNPRHYTIQIFADRRLSSVKDFVVNKSLGSPLAYFESRHEGRPWFSLLYGSFETLQVAKQARDGLPQSLRDRKPWIRSFKTVHLAIKKREQSIKAPTSATPKKKKKEPAVQPDKKLVVEKGKPKSKATKLKSGNALQRKLLRDGQNAFNAGRYDQAVALWQPLAEGGLASAQYNMGFLYESGWGVERNDRLASIWYRRAADQGHLTALYNLALLYVEGRGVVGDARRGVSLVRQAAEAGFSKAQEFMAQAYHDGLYGLPKDAKTSNYWHNKAQLGR